MALSLGGCGSPGNISPPDGLVTRLEYWPEGQIRRVLDPEGLETLWRCDAQKLVTSVVSRDLKDPVSKPRAVAIVRDEEGLAQAICYGIDDPSICPASAPLWERLSYDKLGRLSSYKDTRGSVWQYAHSAMDVLAGWRRSDTPYPNVPQSPPSWDTVLLFDPFVM